MTETASILGYEISAEQLARARAYGIDEETLVELLGYGCTLPPTKDEIPFTDGMPVESERQALQMDLLFEPLRRYFAGQDVYVGKNQTVWYSEQQVRNRDFLGPDLYVVLGVAPHEREGWVIWHEGKAPDVAVEILSPSTAARHRGVKKRIYQENIRLGNYFWFDPATHELAGFRLTDSGYIAIEPDAAGRLPCPMLDLTLVLWDGVYMQRPGPWLRWATRTGDLLPTEAEAEQQRAEAAERAAEVERQRAEAAEREAQEARQRQAELEAELARYRQRLGDGGM